MLDLHFVRENLDKVKEAFEKRHFETDALETFVELDKERREVIGESDEINAKRNSSSKEIGALMQAGKKDEAEVKKAEVSDLKNKQKDLEHKRTEVEVKMYELLAGLPNITEDDGPEGTDESDNNEISIWGEPRDFDFDFKDHVDLGEDLGILDTERAAKITGARFAILNGKGARLERALVNFMLEVHTEQHGYKETLPPFIVNQHSLFGTTQLPKFEKDLFKLVREDEEEIEEKDLKTYYLIPTAEVPVTNYHAGEILEAKNLPMKWTAYTPCFRSEAGSYGRDTRGLIRQHQFEKVEMVKYCLPENSEEEHEKLTVNAETILQMLELPYRKVILSTGDLGFGSHKTYDLEVWLPSQNTYREISSCSNYGDFQARRMNLRFRRAGGEKPEFAHTLNGSGLAVGRTWIAILENYQQEDGSIVIPEVLRPFMNGLEKIEAEQ